MNQVANRASNIAHCNDIILMEANQLSFSSFHAKYFQNANIFYVKNVFSIFFFSVVILIKFSAITFVIE